MRDVLPGEIIVIGEDGLSSIKTHCGGRSSICIFEYIYFARPDSVIEGTSVHMARVQSGRILAETAAVDADIVIGVPDSGLDAALGYSQESGIPYGIGFIKHKYIGRSFIQPSQIQRDNSVKIKLNVIKETVAGKRVIMIDDSIVRGTTCARIVRLLREAGAKEVHVRISSPPFVHSCYFGTDIDSEDRLIAHNCRNTEEIADYIGADSLAYMPAPSLGQLLNKSGLGFCDGCFTGNYPVDVSHAVYKNKFDSKIHEN